MAKKMLIDATHAEETRVVVVDGNRVDDFDFESVNKRQLAGNIYLAKVTRVEPSLQAAFVDYGGNRHGFLAFSEIHPDYYQIPVADREALLAEERAYAETLDDEDQPDKDKPKRRSRSRRKPKSDEARAADDARSAENGSDEAATGDNPDEEGAGETIADETVAQETLTDEAVAEQTVAEEGAVSGEAAPEAPASDESPDRAEAAETTTPDEGGADDDDDTPPFTIAAAARSDDPVETREPGTGIPGMDVVDLGDDETAAPVEDVAGGDESAPAKPRRSSRRRRKPSRTSEPAAGDPGAAEQAAGGPDAGPDAEAESAGLDDVPDAAARDDQIESVADEDVTEEIRPRKPRQRRYKIQEVIKVRQIMLVQVVKEERGNKGAALTTYLSLAGRYCVLMPNTARGGGISRKITNAVDRKKLKDIAGELDVPEGAGLIIRTAGAQRTKSEIKRDYEYLQRLWEQIRELTLKSIAPAPIYEEGDLIKRSIRDLYSREIDEVLVEGERGYRVAKDFMKMIMPSHAKNVKHYAEPMPLFARYQVESYLSSMFNPVVQLKSGGYIVIGVTEALVAIDVNSGRATKEGSIEETALKTNLEAAEEVARQLRLRDLAGLIVIDFIDMEERKNNAAVEKRLKDKLKTDRARIQMGRISGFGLLEMSRQRLRPGMIEATTQPCPHCHGTGLIRSDDNLALSILRQLEEEGVRGRSREVLLKAPVGIVNFLMNQKREHVAQIEARYGLSVRIEADPFLISPDFSLERFKTATRVVPEVIAPVISVDTSDMPEIDEEPEKPAEIETDLQVAEGDEKPKKRRRRRRRKKPGQGAEAQGSEAADSDDGADDTADDGAQEAVSGATGMTAEAAPAEDRPEEGEDRPRKTRSRRSRKRKTEQDEAEADTADQREGEAPGEAVPDMAGPDTAGPVAEAEIAEPEPESAEEPAPEPAEPEPTEPVSAFAEAEPGPEPEPAEPEPAEAEPEPAAVTTAPAEPPVEDADGAEQEADTRPKKRGWWSLGR